MALEAKAEPSGGGSACLDWAARLVARGVNPIPIRARTKRPALAWASFQQRRLLERDTDEVDRYLCSWWDGKEHGLGAVTGRVSEIVVIDLDTAEAADRFTALAGKAVTVAASTGKGMHFWFAHPGGELGNRAAVGGVAGFDVRGDGGYVVCPPSIHPDGGAYRWAVSPADLWPPAPMPRALLEVLRPASLPAAAAPSPDVSGAYVAAALDREAAAVRSSAVGSRNDSLNRAAFALARFVPAELPARDLVARLLEAAMAAGLGEAEALRTIASALRARVA